jgi:hypothetical protein
MLIRVKVVLFTGLRGEPTGSKTKARHGGKKFALKVQFGLFLVNREHSCET